MQDVIITTLEPCWAFAPTDGDAICEHCGWLDTEHDAFAHQPVTVALPRRTGPAAGTDALRRAS